MQVLLYLFSMLFALEDLLKSDGDRVCLQIMCYLTAVTDRVAFFPHRGLANTCCRHPRQLRSSPQCELGDSSGLHLLMQSFLAFFWLALNLEV